MSAGGTPDPATMPRDRSVPVIRAWVACYTRGLPEPIATERRALIDADLWDEAEAARWLGETSGLPRQRWSRWMRGVPADVSWRIDAQRRIAKRPRRTDMRHSKIQLAAIGAAGIWSLVMIFGLVASPGFLEWSNWPFALLGLVIGLSGVLLAIRQPRAGFIVALFGTGMAFFAMPWLFPFFLPVPIALGIHLGLSQPPMPAPGS